MRCKDVLSYYKNGGELERETGILAANYYNWLRSGYIPLKAQLRLEAVTKGRLVASGEDLLTDLRAAKDAVPAVPAAPVGADNSADNPAEDPFIMRDMYFKQLQDAKQIIMLQTQRIAELERELNA